jgi:hypothetical protein
MLAHNRFEGVARLNYASVTGRDRSTSARSLPRPQRRMLRGYSQLASSLSVSSTIDDALLTGLLHISPSVLALRPPEHFAG